jgi:hypothetical protein
MKKLDEIVKTNPFKVPDSYFEEVNRKILSATVGSEAEKIIPAKTRRLRPYLLAAASVAGFILLSYAGLKVYNSPGKKGEIAELIQDENTQPLMNEIDIYTLEENAELFNVEERVPDVNKSDIIDYLLLENVQISDIYQQL